MGWDRYILTWKIIVRKRKKKSTNGKRSKLTVWKSYNGVLKGKNGWMGDDGRNGNRIEKGPNPAFPAPSLHHHQFNSITHIFFLFHFPFVTSRRLVSLSFFLSSFLFIFCGKTWKGKRKKERRKRGKNIYKNLWVIS